jgi:hypothetical protein
MTDSTEKQASEATRPHCGVIMPISPSDGYTAEHWVEILRLVKESASDAGFTCEMVSGETSENDVIHANIVTSIYQNEIAVCDVSSRNPNVMLELGLRLASKKPVVIIFDGEGNYPFDINTIRFIRYRRDMRYYDTQKFKQELARKLIEVNKSFTDGKYQSFLSHFKVIDVELDDISSETQSLKEFLERIDGRLSNLETRGVNASSIHRTLETYAEIEAYIDPKVLATYLATKLIALNFKAPLDTEEIAELTKQLISRFRQELGHAPPSVFFTIVDTITHPYLRALNRIKA